MTKAKSDQRRRTRAERDAARTAPGLKRPTRALGTAIDWIQLRGEYVVDDGDQQFFPKGLWKDLESPSWKASSR
jgi:hypothetical protein